MIQCWKYFSYFAMRNFCVVILFSLWDNPSNWICNWLSVSLCCSSIRRASFNAFTPSSFFNNADWNIENIETLLKYIRNAFFNHLGELFKIFCTHKKQTFPFFNIFTLNVKILDSFFPFFSFLISINSCFLSSFYNCFQLEKWNKYSFDTYMR